MPRTARLQEGQQAGPHDARALPEGASQAQGKRRMRTDSKRREAANQTVQERGVACTYTEPRLDWKTYVWVMLGIQRRTLLRVLERHPTIATQLLRLARKIHARLSRTDTYKVLKDFVTRKLAEAEKDERNVSYAITRKGDAIKKQMLLGWLMMFGFF